MQFKVFGLQEFGEHGPHYIIYTPFYGKKNKENNSYRDGMRLLKSSFNTHGHMRFFLKFNVTTAYYFMMHLVIIIITGT